MATEILIERSTLTHRKGMAGIVNSVGRFARRKPLGAFGAALIVVLAFMAIFANVIAPYDPYKQQLNDYLASPNVNHIMGADNFGRDLFSRILHGARISLYVGLGAVSSGAVFGAVLGLSSAFFGGKFDYIVQRFIDIKQAIPGLILAMAIVSTLGPSVNNVLIAIAIGFIATQTRVIRSAALSIKHQDYMLAAQALGASNRRMMFMHMLPNVMAPFIVLASAELGTAVLTEASLSFLGLGTQPPTPSWGAMLSGDHRRFMAQAPWLVIFPGLAISMAVFGFNLLGDALRDVWDPRLRGR